LAGFPSKKFCLLRIHLRELPLRSFRFEFNTIFVNSMQNQEKNLAIAPL